MSAICGVVGAGGNRGRARRDVGLMLDMLKLRGPDGAKLHDADGPAGRAIAFGVRHLKVNGAAPEAAIALDPETGSFLVCDGQVFNAGEVKTYVEGRGQRLRGNSASDLLLAVYQADGPSGLRRVDGQFAFALWDGRRNQLVLGRDPLGVRAVYYRATRDGVLFASEIKALLVVPDVLAAIDPVGVSHYLTFLTVPGPRTLFAGIDKLAAGSTAVFQADGTAEVKPYWDLLWDAINETDDEAFYVDKVRQLHHDAVSRRMVDGPVGALVSGGNDSSANAVLMSRAMSDPKQLHTFTVGLREVEGEEKYNDMKYAKQVAELIGSQHHEHLMSTDEFLATIPTTIDAMDDLVSEPSAVFLYQALRLAKDQGLSVVVTGEANDEISCGHGEMIKIRQRYYDRWLPFSKLPGPVKKIAAGLAPIIAPKRADLLRRVAADEEYFWNFEIAWPESRKDSILSVEALRATAGHSAGEVVARDAQRLRESEHGNRDYLNHIIYRMMQDYYFGNLMLGKLDLLSAHLGLESRCPYTDAAYAHFVYNIPAKFKQKDGMVKYFFKKAIAGILPDSIIYRPKQGFRTPVVELFKGALGDWGRSALLDGGLTQSGFLRRDAVAGLLSEHRAGVADRSTQLWTVLVLNLWHQRWIGSRPSRAASDAAETGLPA